MKHFYSYILNVSVFSTLTSYSVNVDQKTFENFIDDVSRKCIIDVDRETFFDIHHFEWYYATWEGSRVLLGVISYVEEDK